jgi:vacuolar-type H+-ATPase subunit F/Vma7
MAGIAVIGESARTRAYVLAGCQVLPADDAAAAIRAWELLPADTGLVILTATAAATLAERRAHSTVLTVVMPA